MLKKSMLMVLSAVLFTVLNLDADAKEKKQKNESFIACGTKKLFIKDAAAVWEPGKKQLKIYLFPFKLTSSDIKKIKSGSAWSLCFGKKSPDKKLWPSWCPNATVQIDCSGAEPSRDNATFCNFILFGLEKNNYTANLNKNGKQVQESIQELSVKNRKLTFKSEGSGKIFKESYTWNLSVECPLFTVKEDNR